jgi:signal recognition particle receptor subunit beta
MAKMSREAAEVRARIVYWGIEGAGKTENLRAAFAKLRPDHRGDLREVRSRLDPSASYEVLPIALGEVAGIRTQIEMVAVPGRPDQKPMRKQLLDQVDGVVFVADARAALEDNLASFEELREALAAYGRDLAEVPLAVQYNKRDLADPFAIEDLHRKLAPGDAPIFEAVATDGTGVLQTLSTISKRVIRALRDGESRAAPASPAAPRRGPAPPERLAQAIEAEPLDPHARDLDAVTEEAQTLLDAPLPGVPGEIERPHGAQVGPDLTIVSVGEATRAGERAVRIPLVLGDRHGGTSTLVLTVQLDALLEEDPG